MAKNQKQIQYTVYENAQTLKVEHLNEYGEGIAYLDGYEIYLKGAVDGETVLAQIGEPFANGSKRRPGTIKEILISSPDREECFDESNLNIYPYAHLTYKGTLKRKQKMIKDALLQTKANAPEPSLIEECDVNSTCRFKSIRYFAEDSCRVVNGFYRMRSHEVLKVTSCPFEPLWFSDFANRLCYLFTDKKVSVYNETTLKGTLRSLLLRDTIQGRLCVLNINESKADDSFRNDYLNICREFLIDAVYLNFNPESGNTVLKGQMECLTEKKSITLNLKGLSYSAGPYTFLQVNYPVAQKLYEYAVNFCKKDAPEKSNALDMCCGCGTMTLMLGKHFCHVTGVEIVKEAVEAARENALINGIENVSFIAGDMTEVIPKLASERDIYAAICDPSRNGLGEQNCKTLASIKSLKKIAFIFCSLKALRRDVKTLCECGFKVDEVKGFDMFPYTSHVETVVLMSRVNKG